MPGPWPEVIAQRPWPIMRRLGATMMRRLGAMAGIAVLLAGCAMMSGEDPAEPAQPQMPPSLVKPVQVPMPAAAPEAKPEAVTAEPVPPPAAPVPRFAGHVASYRSLADAEKFWPGLVKGKPIAGGLTPRFVEIDLGGQRGKVVRALLGSFPEQDGAREFCRELRKEGLFCAPHPLPPAPETDKKS